MPFQNSNKLHELQDMQIQFQVVIYCSFKKNKMNFAHTFKFIIL